MTKFTTRKKIKNLDRCSIPHPDCHFLIGRGRGTPDIKVHLPIIPDFRNHYLEAALHHRNILPKSLQHTVALV